MTPRLSTTQLRLMPRGSNQFKGPGGNLGAIRNEGRNRARGPDWGNGKCMRDARLSGHNRRALEGYSPYFGQLVTRPTRDFAPRRYYTPTGSQARVDDKEYERSPELIAPVIRSNVPPDERLAPTIHKSSQPVPSIKSECAHPSPSASYLSITKQESRRQPVLDLPRKLLILDLNGTLIYRQFPKAPTVPPQRHTFGPKIRPRPYLQTFVQYIFHPENQKWLDVMIWSSAQPKNVVNMVKAALGVGGEFQLRPTLRAVWARDTLGLAPNSYDSKVQTYKDLELVWGHLNHDHQPNAIDNSPGGSHNRSNFVPPPVSWQSPKFYRGVPQTTGAIERVLGMPSNANIQHSARTTLLVDDSVTKACMQPFNHLCVAEYEETMFEENADDTTLLAVIGVLEESGYQSNLAAWIQGNGVYQGTDADGNTDGYAVGTDTPMWYQNEKVFQYWAERGRAVVSSLGIYCK